MANSGKVIWSVTMSLDGFIAVPNDEMDWVFEYDDPDPLVDRMVVFSRPHLAVRWRSILQPPGRRAHQPRADRRDAIRAADEPALPCPQASRLLTEGFKASGRGFPELSVEPLSPGLCLDCPGEAIAKGTEVLCHHD